MEGGRHCYRWRYRYFLYINAEQVGKVISVAVNYTDGGGVLETVTSAETAEIGNINDAPFGQWSIDGTAEENQVLSAVNNFSDEDGLPTTFSYQWYADGSAINGATSENYTLSQNEVGKHINVSVIYTDNEGTTETIPSDQTDLIVNVNDSPTGTVAISGVIQEGQILSAVITDLEDEDGVGVLSYEWQADGQVIDGAGDSSYTLTQSEVGKTISVQVSYIDNYGTTETFEGQKLSEVTHWEYIGWAQYRNVYGHHRNSIRL